MRRTHKLTRRSFLGTVSGTPLLLLTGEARGAVQITDCDSGPGYDPAGRGTGQRCRSGTPSPPPPPPTGVTDCDAGQGADPGGRGTGRTPCGSRLSATLDCAPLSINRAELPSRNCHILISGFRRNTADPVEVILPEARDGFGNHANGIQITGAGSTSTSGWPDSYSWGLFIFACPSQRGTGANCYSSAAALGPFSVPIIIRQRGAGEVRINLTGNVNRHPTNDPGGPDGPAASVSSVVRIHNRWRQEQFLNIEIGLASSAIQPQWLSALWRVETTDSGFFRIGSQWQRDRYLHMESGRLECAPIQPQWWSAMWAFEVVDSAFVRIRNRWRTDQYLHTESGRLETGPIRPEWSSAMWRLEPA